MAKIKLLHTRMGARALVGALNLKHIRLAPKIGTSQREKIHAQQWCEMKKVDINIITIITIIVIIVIIIIDLIGPLSARAADFELSVYLVACRLFHGFGWLVSSKQAGNQQQRH